MPSFPVMLQESPTVQPGFPLCKGPVGKDADVLILLAADIPPAAETAAALVTKPN